MLKALECITEFTLVRNPINVKSVSSGHQLILQSRFHTGEKPYECKACGKPLVCMNDLLDLRVFTVVERPLECNKCGKSFRLSSGLKVYRKIHIGEKHHECKDCGKAYICSRECIVSHCITLRKILNEKNMGKLLDTVQFLRH